MNLYLDASASVKLFLEETESAAVKASLRDAVISGGKIFVSTLTVLETRRALLRNQIATKEAARFFQSTDVVAITPLILEQAGTLLPRTLKTLDAIHLATALVLRQAAEIELMAFDRMLLEAGVEAGVRVTSPGL